MKRLFLSFAFLLAIGAAFFTHASNSPLAVHYYQADPTNIAATCQPIDCVENQPQACTLVKPNFTTYKSVDPQPACNTPLILKKRPQ